MILTPLLEQNAPGGSSLKPSSTRGATLVDHGTHSGFQGGTQKQLGPQAVPFPCTYNSNP